MTGAQLARIPVWEAALYAAACQVRHADGLSSTIPWQFGPECVFYTANDAVTVEPFGIALTPGAMVEVRWPMGASGYSIAVRQPEGSSACGKLCY